MADSKKQIVVVGGGFAGINFIKSLGNNPNYQVTLVDINNYNFFPPLIYQVATAFIDSSNISMPFRKMFKKHRNFAFHLGKLLNIDSATNTVVTDTGLLRYDYLVLAVGTETNYFGMENVKKNAFPMKNITDALAIRNKILLNLEDYIQRKDESNREAYLNIVVAGGGPSGVEISGMIAELSERIVKKEYPELVGLTPRIHLVDAAPVLLGPMSQVAQQEAKSVLEKLGVEITLNVAVKDYQNDVVALSDGKEIPTKTLIWTSGVIARELPGIPTEKFGRGRRVLVDEFNAVQGYDNIFAIGDICLQTTDAKFPNGHPQLAQVAMQQGTLLAKNIVAKNSNSALKPFAYWDKGSMAVIARYKAVADLPNFSFKGWFAWLTWLLIHLVPIASFRNKWKLLGNWIWSFYSANSGLRLIIRSERKRDAKEVRTNIEG
ncbi:NAD(P)/FAD-dependent oxidoreductase [Sphingobacterium oryzagri]|uniref:NADH:ubiquinone reductase (non-electrogenic) n=1 Tax=Sphingobacterium oryzagri TaxID=3025669 RepID=A0ABY7WKU4_9SPHI|nr:NAD(P)/FAD-dependent oxidoreductase [Sphingobacterium sp. KACC 22765]WDF70217.1 NAD(P)/FAD-dependent oxidoreductase [Sphingobacterium sp. KACC 22765]